MTHVQLATSRDLNICQTWQNVSYTAKLKIVVINHMEKTGKGALLLAQIIFY